MFAHGGPKAALVERSLPGAALRSHEISRENLLPSGKPGLEVPGALEDLVRSRGFLYCLPHPDKVSEASTRPAAGPTATDSKAGRATPKGSPASASRALDAGA